MFRAVLFIITKNWKQSIHQLVNQLAYPYDAVISQQCRGMNYWQKNMDLSQKKKNDGDPKKLVVE